MPKRDIATIAHSAITNHRIPRRREDPAPADAPATTSGSADLVQVNGRPDVPPPAIALLQAYGELMEQRPEYGLRFNDLLDRASQTHGDDPLVLAMLGRRALRSNAPEEAIRYLTRSIERGSASSGVFEDLGEALARAGRPADALGILRRGIQLAPFNPELYKSAALRYIALGQREDALKMLNLYLGLFPQDDFIRDLLARLSRRP
jgi:predicted Zn-dependent protease